MTDRDTTERSTAEPITAVLADRVRELRERAGMSQADLAEQMTKLGTPWKRATVVNLEKRGTTSRKRPGSTAGRDAVTVQELLALAQVFGVPLIWLLADPQAGTAVPIAEGVELDPWMALLWLTGWQPLEGSDGGAWASTNNPLYQLHALGSELARYRSMRRFSDVALVPATVDQQDPPAGVLPVWGDLDEARRELDAPEAVQLRVIANRLGQFREQELSIPQMPRDVRKRAAELGIELPGQEG